jgi:hypothetical protein
MQSILLSIPGNPLATLEACIPFTSSTLDDLKYYVAYTDMTVIENSFKHSRIVFSPIQITSSRKSAGPPYPSIFMVVVHFCKGEKLR